jgi:hypothetical protein
MNIKEKKLLVFTIALNGYEKTFKSCIDSQRVYCEKNNYKYIVVDHSPRDMEAIESAWIKIPLILTALKAGYEWVAFIDSDCEIRENTPPFDVYLSNEDPNKSLFISIGKSGRLNSGVMIIRTSHDSISFFDKVYNYIDEKVPETDRTAFENGHIIYFGKDNNDIALLDHKEWNNNSTLDDSSYIQHYSSGALRNHYFEVHGKYNPKRGLFFKLKKLFWSKKRVDIGKGYYEGKLSDKVASLLAIYIQKYPSFLNPDNKL